MKKLFAALALVFLSSCIDVDEMGTVWEKADMLPALAGSWRMNGTHDSWRFVKLGNAYRVDKVEASDKPQDDDSPLARTVTMDNMDFLLLKDQTKQKGTLIRFELHGDVATQYGFENLEPVIAWLKSNYPKATMLSTETSSVSGVGLKITRLDETTLAVLSKVPAEFWSVTATYTKLK